jgi:hypothetical protein
MWATVSCSTGVQTGQHGVTASSSGRFRASLYVSDPDHCQQLLFQVGSSPGSLHIRLPLRLDITGGATEKKEGLNFYMQVIAILKN